MIVRNLTPTLRVLLAGRSIAGGDNVVANAGTGGATFATDTILGIEYPRSKVVWGPNNTATDADVGAAAIPVQDGGNSLTIDGTVTANLGTIAGASTAAKQPALGTAGVPSTDVLSVQGIASGTALPITGTLTAVTALTNALPAGTNAIGKLAANTGVDIGDVDVTSVPAPLSTTGGGTEATALRVTVASDSTGVLSVDDNGGSLTIDGTITANAGSGTMAVSIAADTVVIGTDAHDAAISGDPLTIGGRASAAAPVAVSADNDAVRAWFLLNGAQAVNVTAAGALIGGDAANGLDVDVTRLPALVAGTANIGDVDVLTVPAPLSTTGGGTEATALRVTVASDSTGVLSVDDNGGSLTVDGTVAVSSLPALVAGTANIGDVDVLTLPGIAGDIAHDSADSGNPVKIGMVARTSDPTAVANADRVNAISDLNGKQVTLPYTLPENMVSGATAAITGTADTSVIAAQGVGIRLYITQILVTNSHATVGTLVEILDNITTIYRGFAAALGGGFAVTFPVPLRLAANVALQAKNITTGSNTYVSASGYKAP